MADNTVTRVAVSSKERFGTVYARIDLKTRRYRWRAPQVSIFRDWSGDTFEYPEDAFNDADLKWRRFEMELMAAEAS